MLSAKAQVLNSVPGTQGLAFGLPDEVGPRAVVANRAAAIAAGDIVDVGCGVVIAGGGGEDARSFASCR